jgi:hypothetical protein
LDGACGCLGPPSLCGHGLFLACQCLKSSEFLLRFGI